MKLVSTLKSVLVAAALCATFAGTATAAVAAIGCRDAQCLGGGLHCADLPNGVKCYTLIIIETDPAPGPVVVAN